jgi:DNA-binding transcriptional regulator YiaG
MEKGHLTDEVLAEYDATHVLKSPFKVILTNSVYKVFNKERDLVETVIPEPKQLLKAVALARVLHPHKLNGANIKFLRSAIGEKSKDLAGHIGVSPEHLSRCENGLHPLSPQSERLVRVYVFVLTLPFTPKKNESASQAVERINDVFGGLYVQPAHSIDDELVLSFSLRHRGDGAGGGVADDSELWDDAA